MDKFTLTLSRNEMNIVSEALEVYNNGSITDYNTSQDICKSIKEILNEYWNNHYYSTKRVK